MFYTNSVSEFLLVTIHAPSGDGNILQQFNVNYYFKLQSTPRQGTEMRVCCRVGLRARRVTIHAPSGDGYGVSCEHRNIGETTQLRPARGQNKAPTPRKWDRRLV